MAAIARFVFNKLESPEDQKVRTRLTFQTGVAKIAAVVATIFCGALALSAAVSSSPFSFAAWTVCAVVSYDCFRVAENLHGTVSDILQWNKCAALASAASKNPQEQLRLLYSFLKNTLLLRPLADCVVMK